MYAPAVWAWIEKIIYIIVVVHILEKNSFCGHLLYYFWSGMQNQSCQPGDHIG
jgi:hypothetical protein